MLLTFDSKGDTYFQLQFNGDILDTAQRLDSWLLQPPAKYPYYCYFNQAGDARLIDGVTLTGATSGAVIKVGHVVLTGGALTSAGLGVLFFQKVSGEIVNGENLQVAASTYCVAGSKALDCPFTPARSLFIQPESNNIRYALGGLTPTSSTGTPANMGFIVEVVGGVPGDAIIRGWKDVQDFQMIHAVAAANAVVNVTVMF